MATVEHRPEENRYVVVEDGADIGEEKYVDVGEERVLFHTVISEDHGGKGLASLLVRTVVDDLVASGLRVVPVCPYVKAWLPKHPEYADHVVSPTRAHLRAIARQESQNAGG